MRLDLLLFARDWAKRAAKRLFSRNQRMRGLLRRLDAFVCRMMAPGVGGSTAGRAMDAGGIYGVNVAGYFTGDFGVAEGARADVRALEAAGVPYVRIRIDTPGRWDEGAAGIDFSSENPYRYNLIHVNAEQAHDFYRRSGRGLFAGRFNIGYWVWELSQFPEDFAGAFQYYDEIWTPSAFSADAISRLSTKPVVRMPHAVSIEGGAPARGRFGLSDDEFIFLFAFDFYSIFERKNPLAAVAAFKSAFGDDPRFRLVIKHLHADNFPNDFEILKRRAVGKNVTLMGGRLTRAEFVSLMASCDSYVSLHRSEGFGLTIAEAMAMGKPVIATDYSGSADFMNADNGFPVRYRLVELKKGLPPYLKGGVWAEPDAGHAAELMRLVSEDRGLAGTRGKKAEEHIRLHLSPSAVGGLYKGRLDWLERHMGRAV